MICLPAVCLLWGLFSPPGSFYRWIEIIINSACLCHERTAINPWTQLHKDGQLGSLLQIIDKDIIYDMRKHLQLYSHLQLTKIEDGLIHVWFCHKLIFVMSIHAVREVLFKANTNEVSSFACYWEMQLKCKFIGFWIEESSRECWKAFILQHKVKEHNR